MIKQYVNTYSYIAKDVTAMTEDKMIWQVYILENLGCAHCASQMEAAIRKMPAVEDATIVFASKELRLLAAEPAAQLPAIEKICQQIEAAVKIVPRRKGAKLLPPVASSRELGGIVFGAVLFSLGLYRGADFWQTTLFVAAYLILGRLVLLQAGQNLRRGRALDENFLMAVATLGAFAIGEQPEAVGIMFFYRIGEYFEARAVDKSRAAVLAAADLQPDTVHRLGTGGGEDIPTAEAGIGDILLIRPGDRVPVDGIIVQGESRIDTAAVTGESVPIRAVAGDELFSGYLNATGVLQLRVTKPASASMAARILAAVEAAAAAKPQLERFISRFARVYTPLVVGAALLTAFVPPLFTGQWEYWIYTALTFLVISCPCALVLSVPLAFFAAIGAGSKRGILFKGGASLEALAKVRQVVFDKTGTLTKGDFSVQEIVLFADLTETEVLRLAAGAEAHSTHPLAASILAAADAAGLELQVPLAVEEIAGQGIRAKLPGGEVLCGNEKLLADRQIALPAVAEGYGTRVYVALDGRAVGCLIAADAIKPEAAGVIRQLQVGGQEVSVLTGDSPASAAMVAERLGIANIRAGLLPEAKLAELQKLRQQYGAALFVGDGINDAPVLAGADCSAAMGGGSAMAIEAADIVFLNAKVSGVLQALGIARSARRIAWQNIVLALGTKAAILLLGLAGFASLWLAIFADTGVALLCVLNSVRLLYRQGDFA